MTQQSYQHLCGWVNDPAEVEAVLAELPMPSFAAAAPHLAGKGAKRVALLWKACDIVLGEQPIYPVQTIGDCVSHGFGRVVDLVKCLQIVAGRRQKWIAQTASEPIYGGSRVEVGGGRIRGDGSVGAWAAKWISQYGVLSRIKYGEIDLTSYSGERAREYGRKGCPDVLEPIARERVVRTVSLVTSYEQARDAIANGHPIAVCSNQGFASKRDADGFARAQGAWGHCMAFIAADDEFKRPGLLCCNRSWGQNWIDGPKRLRQPDGTFWVDADVADRMLRQGDSFAASEFDGYPDQELDYMLI